MSACAAATLCIFVAPPALSAASLRSSGSKNFLQSLEKSSKWNRLKYTPCTAEQLRFFEKLTHYVLYFCLSSPMPFPPPCPSPSPGEDQSVPEFKWRKFPSPDLPESYLQMLVRAGNVIIFLVDASNIEDGKHAYSAVVTLICEALRESNSCSSSSSSTSPLPRAPSLDLVCCRCCKV